jgi:tRNA G18 (ribose-2'-O)-methylase SpoU
VWQPKTEYNLGTLWRNAYCFNASFIGLIGRRFKRENTDTVKAWRHVPLYEYEDWDHFLSCRPYNCKLIAIDLVPEAQRLETFCHPERCIYLLGGEDRTLPRHICAAAQHVVKIRTAACLNVAQAGGIVMYDRQQKTSNGVRRES